MNSTLDLSVIIVSYRGRELLEKCLESVFESMNSISFEVIVVENDSQDGSFESLKEQFPSTVLLRNPVNRGFPAAVNQAIQVARGRYYLLLNQDTELVDRDFSDALDYMDCHPQVGLLGLRQVDSEMRPIPSTSMDRCLKDRRITLALSTLYLTKLFPRAKSGGERPFQVGYANSAALLVSCGVFEKIGLLDERFFFMMEELDLGFRANEGGFQTHFFPGFRVLHHRSSGEGFTLWRLLQYHFGELKLYGKHRVSVLEVRFLRAVWLLTRIGTSLLKTPFVPDRKEHLGKIVILFKALIWHLSGGVIRFGLQLK